MQPSQPSLSSAQTERLLLLHKKRPDLFTDQKVAEIRQAAAAYGLEAPPVDENYFTEIPKQLLGGFIKEFTIFVDPFDAPKTPVASIAKSVGGVFGFVGSFFGLGNPLQKAGARIAEGLELKGASMAGALNASERTIQAGKALEKAGKLMSSVELRSMPMLSADLAMKGLKKLGAYEAAMGSLKGSHPILQQMLEEGLHLGVASMAAALPEGVGAAVQSGLWGAVSGGAFGAIGNIPEINKMGSVDKILKAAAGSVFQGLPGTLQGQTAPEQVYNYLLGAYFGYHSPDVTTFNAIREIAKVKPQDQAFLINNKDVVQRVTDGDLDPAVYKRMVQMIEDSHKPRPVRQALSLIFRSLGTAGKAADVELDKNLDVKEGADLRNDQGTSVGKVIAITPDGYVVVRRKDGKEFTVLNKDAKYRMTEVVDDLNDAPVTNEKTDAVRQSQPDDMDAWYADYSDPVTNFLKEVYGKNITRDQFIGLRRNVSDKIKDLALQTRARLAQDPTLDRAKLFDEQMANFKEYIRISSVTDKPPEDFSHVQQFLTREVTSSPVPLMHIDHNNRARMLAPLPQNENMLVTPELNVKDGRIPAWPVQTIFNDVNQVIQIDSYAYRDKNGAVQVGSFEDIADLEPIVKALRKFRLTEDRPDGEYYLAAGDGEKPLLIAHKYLFDLQGAKDYLRAFYNEHQKDFPLFEAEFKLGQKRAFDGAGITESEYIRQYASNMEYYRRTVLGEGVSWKEAADLKDPLTGKPVFINSVLDFNKRQQIQYNTFYPVSPGVLKRDKLRYIVVNDFKDMAEKRVMEDGRTAYILKLGDKEVEIDAEVSDGGSYTLMDIVNALKEGYNLPREGAIEKTFIYSRHPELGTMMNKHALHGIDPKNSKLAQWMVENGIDMIHFRTATKQIGKRAVRQLHYDGEKYYTTSSNDGEKIRSQKRAEDAYMMKGQLEASVQSKGMNIGEFGAEEPGTKKVTRWNVSTSPEWYRGLKTSKERVLKALDEVIMEQPKSALAKRLDQMIEDRMINGYTDPDGVVSPDMEYINALKGGNDTVYEMPTSDLRLSWQVYDKGRASGWETFPKQMWTNSSDLRGGLGFSEAISDIMRSAAVSTREGKEILDKYRQTRDPKILKRIFNWTKDADVTEDSLAHQIGSQDMLDMMREDRAFESQALAFIARHAVRARKESGEVLTDGEEETSDKELLADLNTTMDILKFAPSEGIDRSLIYINNLNKMFQRILHNYFVKRITRPRQTNSGKAIMRIWEPELLHSKNYDKGVFYLDDGFRNLEVDGYDPKTFARQKTSLESLFSLKEDLDKAVLRARGANRKKLQEYQKQVEDALEAVVVRVPMDDMAGARVLRFGGFSGRSGGGVLLHHEVMKALGGADNDIDSATVMFGHNKTIKDGFRAVEGAYSEYHKKYPYIGDALVSSDPELLAIVNNKSLFQAFDPYGRTKAGIAVSRGRQKMLPIAVSSKFKMHEFYLAASRAAEKNPEGYVELAWGFPVKDRKGKMVQPTIRFYPRKDNGEMLNAVGSAAINRAADLAGVGGMVTPDELQAMLFHGAFEKVTRYDPTAGEYDIMAGTKLDYTKKGAKRVISPTLLQTAKELRYKVEEFGGLDSANSALYGRNNEHNRAWTPREIQDKLYEFPDKFYEGRPIAEIVKHVRGLDYGYDYLRDFNIRPDTVEELRQKVSALNNLLQNDEQVKIAYSWLDRENQESIMPLLERYRSLVDKKRGFDLFTNEGRKELAYKSNIRAFNKLYRELYSTITDPEIRKDWRQKFKDLQPKKSLGAGDAGFSGFKERVRWLEKEITKVNDLIGTRYQELASYAFLSDMFKRSGIGGMHGKPVYGTMVEYMNRMMKRANSIKQDYATLWRDKYEDRLVAKGVSTALPEEVKKQRDGLMKDAVQELARVQAMYEKAKKDFVRWQGSQPKMEHYLGAQGLFDESGRLTPTGVSSMARFEHEWRQEGADLSLMVEHAAKRVELAETKIREFENRWHEEDLKNAMNRPAQDMAEILRNYEDSKAQVAKTAAIWEQTYGLDAKQVTNLFDAFMLSDISFTKEAWHSNLGMKVADPEVINVYKQNYREAYNVFGGAPSDLSTTEQVRRFLLKEEAVAKVTGSDNTERIEVHDRVFWEMLPKTEGYDQIEDPEVRRLALSITQKLQKFPQIDAETLVGIIRNVFRMAQPHQLDVYHLRGLDNILDSWLQGPGFVNEYLGWLKKTDGKGPKPPGFMDWIQFVQTVADKTKRDMLVTTIHNLYNPDGTLNRAPGPLRYFDEAQGKMVSVMARQVVAETPIDIIQNAMRKASAFSMQQHAASLAVIQQNLGWTTRGIKADGDNKNHADELFEYAIRRIEYDGARQYLRELRMRDKAEISQEFKGPVTKAQWEKARSDERTFLRRLIEKNEYYGSVKKRMFHVESADPGKAKEVITGEQVIKRMQESYEKVMEKARDLIRITPEELKESASLDYDHGYIMVNAQRSFKNFELLFRQTSLSKLLSYDMGQFQWDADTKHFMAREEAAKWREAHPETFDKAGEARLIGKNVSGWRKRMVDEVLNLTHNSDIADAASYFTPMKAWKSAAERRVWLYTYIDVLRAGPEEAAARIKNIMDGVGKYKGINNLAVRREAAKFAEGHRTLDEETQGKLMDKAWTVQEYLYKYWDGDQHIYPMLYGEKGTSMFQLDLDFYEGKISPETYFYKRAEWKNPFQRTQLIKGYWPHLDHDKVATDKWADEQVERIKQKYGPLKDLSDTQKKLMEEELDGVINAVTRDSLTTNTEDGYLNVNMAESVGRSENTSVSIQKMEKLTAQKAGNMFHRTDNIPGYGYGLEQLEKYFMKMGKATYNTFAGFQVRRVIDKFERMGAMDKWMGKEATPAWSFYMRSYFRDVLGYPTLFTKDQWDEEPGKVGAILKLRKTPYGILSDHMAFVKGTVVRKAAVQLLKLNEITKPEMAKLEVKYGRPLTQTEIQREKDDRMKLLTDPTEKNMEDYGQFLRNLSVLESQYQMATLLFSSKSAFGNIYGAAVNTGVWTGMRPMINALNFKIWKEINPNWNNMQDVYNWVISTGTMEEFIIHEGNALQTKYGPKIAPFIDDVVKMIKKDPHMEDESLLKLARKHGVAESLLNGAAFFMRKTERFARVNAFLSTYLQARSDIEATGTHLDHDNPWLVDVARKGVEATQFLYSNIDRPAFARTNLGHIYSRFKLWSWSNVKFQRQVYEAARNQGFRPGSVEMERVRRLMTANLFALGLASLLPFTIFDAALPAPLSYLQNLADWMFGDSKERERAFFTQSTGLPQFLAPLNELMPPISRVPKGIIELPDFFSSIWSGDYKHAAHLTTVTLFPFGRMSKDLWRAYDDPAMAVDVLTGIPLNTLARMKTKKKLREQAQEEQRLRQEKEAADKEERRYSALSNM